MISQQSNVFSKFAFIFFSSLVLPFCSSFRSISTIDGSVSRRHSRILKTEEEFLLNPYPFFQRFMVLASCHPHNCFRLWEFFSSIRSISGVFSVWFSGGYHFRRFIHSSLQLSFYKSYRCIVQISSNQFMISCSHISKSPQVSSFVLQFFPVNCAFATFIFNSFGGLFKISLPSLSYQFIY